jgi:hypothetical protein
VPAAARGRGSFAPRGRGGFASGGGPAPYVSKLDNRPTRFLVKTLPEELNNEEKIRTHFLVRSFEFLSS